MKLLTLLALLISINSFACALTGKNRHKNHFIEAMNENSLVVIATVKRTYHRKDKCTVKKFCRSSGLVIHVDETLKGNPPRYIEGYKANYSSCYSNFHPVNWDKVDGMSQRAPSYLVGKSYLFVLNREPDDYAVIAGKELEQSLNLIKEFSE